MAGNFGYSLENIGDQDGNGLAELAIGVPNGATTDGIGLRGHVEITSPVPRVTIAFEGTGCPMTSGGQTFAPMIGTQGGPPSVQTGNPAFAITLVGAPGNATAALFYGLRTPSWNGLPIPLALAPYGFPGCQLSVSPEFFIPLALTASPSATPMVLSLH